ncbi:hypothetical protein HY989_02685 [Candidatus Micrarchaeota archaeon]|nr:hypothetical protein [Candidatus Micrarchaeota archaeon]
MGDITGKEEGHEGVNLLKKQKLQSAILEPGPNGKLLFYVHHMFPEHAKEFASELRKTGVNVSAPLRLGVDYHGYSLPKKGNEKFIEQALRHFKKEKILVHANKNVKREGTIVNKGHEH